MSSAPQIPIEFRMLGLTGFDTVLQLQSQLQRETWCSTTPKMTVLFCEHPRLVTIGRQGSRAHVRWTDEHLRRRRLSLRWTARRGGCVVHGPGQLAIYAVAPLEELQIDFATFQERLQAGISQGLESLGVFTTCEPPGALVGRTGVLASLGAAVEQGVTGYGAYVNVHPDLADYAYVDAAFPDGGSPRVMTNLLSETRTAGKMAAVRSALVESVAESFNAPPYHLFTGHPSLARSSRVG